MDPDKNKRIHAKAVRKALLISAYWVVRLIEPFQVEDRALPLLVLSVFMRCKQKYDMVT